MTTDELVAMALAEGYFLPRVLPEGRVICLHEQIYTVGLIEIDEHGVLQRYCYENLGDALEGLTRWDLKGDPPGLWVKQKLPVERVNPNWSRARGHA